MLEGRISQGCWSKDVQDGICDGISCIVSQVSQGVRRANQSRPTSALREPSGAPAACQRDGMIVVWGMRFV